MKKLRNLLLLITVLIVTFNFGIILGKKENVFTSVKSNEIKATEKSKEKAGAKTNGNTSGNGNLKTKPITKPS